MELKAFKQYGCLPLFDFDEFKDSFDIRKQHASESVDEWLSDLHSIATSYCCGDGETIRLLGQVIFGVNNDAKWHLEQASQLKHDEQRINTTTPGNERNEGQKTIDHWMLELWFKIQHPRQLSSEQKMMPRMRENCPFSTACPVIRKGFLVSEILNDELQSVENKAAIQKTTALEIGPHWTAHTLLKRLIHKPECNENEVGGVNCQIGRLHYHCNSILTRLRPVETCPSILLTNSSQWFAVVFGLIPRNEESRYAMIVLECSEAVWAMEGCRQYIEELYSFLLLTDQKSLVPFSMITVWIDQTTYAIYGYV
ncbi:hypothetical protein T4E_4741 [Trichinella pseudospiralis]|uniref:Uncharacterized protein n=2 Tax=Trichinella pseudospiralis TaxID=6337 RepID=A0A0V0XDX8_TRIPS|nr:hypothetical protein T4E_4741 [Trichinella pseudospiralis]